MDVPAGTHSRGRFPGHTLPYQSSFDEPTVRYSTVHRLTLDEIQRRASSYVRRPRSHANLLLAENGDLGKHPRQLDVMLPGKS
jgi:hypothetical protein